MTEGTTRILALGNAALVEGFALLGFEAYPDASAARMEEVLAELYQQRASALVLVEHDLAAAGGPWFRRIRAEGGRIVITEVPPLHDPGGYRPQVEDLVLRILGSEALGT